MMVFVEGNLRQREKAAIKCTLERFIQLFIGDLLVIVGSLTNEIIRIIVSDRLMLAFRIDQSDLHIDDKCWTDSMNQRWCLFFDSYVEPYKTCNVGPIKRFGDVRKI